MSSQTTQATVTITATHKNGSVRRYDLEAGQGVFLGKSDNCGLQLEGEGLSDIHCRIGYEDGEICVQDWMSAEGTRLNGKELDDQVPMRPGDVVEIGSYSIGVGSGGASATTDTADHQESAAADLDQEIADQVPAESSCTNSAGARFLAAGRDDDPSGSPESDELSEVSVEQTVSEFEAAEVEISARLRELVADEPADQGVALNDTTECQTEAGSPLGEDVTADRSVEGDEAIGFADEFFEFEEEETYDRETVALLQAEIEDLQAALAQRDAEAAQRPSESVNQETPEEEASDEVLQRMQELIEEANRSDERVALLEEMLHAAEDASRAEQEERNQLEAWVGDIETRIGQRESEQEAEMEALRQRLDESQEQQEKLQRQLRQAVTNGGGAASQQLEETLATLQESNRQLQDDLAAAQQQCRSLEQRLDQQSGECEGDLREERAAIAKEQAKISRLRYELSAKLAAIEEAPKEAESNPDKETAQRIRTLREHLREIHEQEKQEEKDETITSRLAKLWKRVEY